MTPATVLSSENNYSDDSIKKRIYGPEVRVIFPKTSTSPVDLSDEDYAAAEGLLILRYQGQCQRPQALPSVAGNLPDGHRLRQPELCRGGRTQTMILNVPDYGLNRGYRPRNRACTVAVLPKGAVVVNTARGPIIDIDALATLLKVAIWQAWVSPSCPWNLQWSLCPN